MKILLGIIGLVILVLLLRAGELYTQLARYQRYWDKANQKPINKEDIVYVALGDSAAQGVGASKPQKGYVGLFANKLEEKSGNPVRILNLSKSGAKVADVLNTQLPRYEKLNLNNPTVVTIDVGANDVVNFDADKFEKEMDELMGRLPKEAIISDFPTFEGSRLSRLDSKVEEANSIMYKLAEKHNFKLAELNKRVTQNHGIRTFGGDFFHPSDYGYKTNWLPAFWDRFNSSKIAL